MKRIKRLASLLLAMVMAMAMTITVFASGVENPPTPPANEPDRVQADLTGHTYTAYQIFAGTQSADSENKLATITWGSGIDAEGFMSELTTSTEFGDVNPFAGIAYVENNEADTRTGNVSATAVAKVLADNFNNTAMADTFAKIADKYVTTGSATVVDGEQATLSAGYYLVADTTDPLPGERPVRNVSVLQLTKQDTFAPQTKVDVPEVTKKVKNTDDATNPATETDWQDHADYDTGDDVPFILTGTLPTDYARYDTYKYVFHDTQSDGLSFNTESVEVKIDGVLIDRDSYNLVTEGLTDGCTFEVSFANLKNLSQVTAESIITVEYTAELTAEAIPDANGITNSVKLEYSNNPRSGGDGDTGTTPEDVVTVFTYKIVANKTDENGQPLSGAAFTLYKLIDGNYEELEVLNEGTEFSFKGIDAGQYKLAETVVPDGYNRAQDIEFKVVPEYDTDVETPTLKELKLTDLDGNEVEGAEFTITVGTATTQIQNLRGSLLPSTGGIGTTIFYVVGGILVVAAGILLVTKKRMSAR